MNTEQQIYFMFILTIVEHGILAVALFCLLIYKWYKKRSWTDRQRDILEEQLEELRDIVIKIAPKTKFDTRRRW